MSKRTLLTILGGVLAFAVVVGSAASLGGITSSHLGADDAVVASCDTSGVTSIYTSLYNTTGTDGFKVNDVTVGALDDACDGDTMTVTLTGAAGAALGSQTEVLPTGVGTTNAFNFVSDDVLSELVTGISIVVTD